MKVTNIGTKIVNIGSDALLPGKTIDLDPKFEGNDVLTTLAEMNLISISGKKAAPKPADDSEAKKRAAAEAAAKKTADEEAAKKTAEEAAKNASGSK